MKDIKEDQKVLTFTSYCVLGYIVSEQVLRLSVGISMGLGC